VLCSPNNPTGSSLEEKDVRRVLEGTAAIVALDEAYVHFSKGSLVRLLDTYDRLVLLQTFSKAMGAAGLRFGYLLGAPALVSQLAKVKLPYNVNVFTLAAVGVLIDRWPEYRRWIDAIVEERERVLAAMSRIGTVRVYPSGGNFLLFETLRRTPAELFRSILERGILIRDVSSYPGLSRGLRVTIGTSEENNSFLAALTEAA
jgi:histidinol-phosphate aminotransferase